MASSGQQFAKSLLKKYGWKEGKGLGREEQGMTSALKPKLKFDSAGLGHDIAKDYKFHWWDHVFNKAAENISVDKTPDGSVQLTKKKELHISKKKPSRTDHKATFYGGFVMGGTLVGAKEIKDCSESEERDMSLRLTDEELFKICGGRTAHKGARHGLTMTAKLARVEEQERILMQKWSMSAEQLPEEPCEVETLEKKHRKKKRKHLDEDLFKKDTKTLGIKELKMNTEVSEDEVPHILVKDLKNDKTNNKKRKIKREVNIMDSSLEYVENTSSRHILMLNIEQTNSQNSEKTYKSKEKKKKKKNIVSSSDNIIEITDNGTETTGEINNTEKENYIEEKKNSCTETAELEEEITIKKKKDKKRKKLKHLKEREKQQSDCEVPDAPKKKKKKRKKDYPDFQ